MAGIFISICIQNTQQCDKMDKNGQGSGKGIDPVSGQGHPDQYQGDVYKRQIVGLMIWGMI